VPLTELVDQYGYGAVFVGSLLEGETILLLAGIAANRDYLSFWAIVLLACCGGTIGDQVLFQLGRRYGTNLLGRFPGLARRAEPIHRLIERHQIKLIVGVRFMYGLRLVGPFAIGMTDVPLARFAMLNLLGAALWAPLVVGAGYVFGQSISWLVQDLGLYEAIALCALLAFVATAYFLHRRRRRD
jgi:membrane protein DedA with SNARE-associated domain